MRRQQHPELDKAAFQAQPSTPPRQGFEGRANSGSHLVRINKYLAERGVCSRRQADRLIDEGLVRVDGRRAEKGMVVSGEEDIVVDGQRMIAHRPALQYLAFHKPVGILTSVDPNGRDTIATFLNLQERLFPIGRLDVASSGLLILTNDGNLSEAITHPRGHHEKEYIVTVEQELENQDLRTMESGMMILGSMTKRAVTKRMGPHAFRIILTEGRNRQIRRMCEQLGYSVKSLKRVRVLNITLDNLPPGKTRTLSRKEVTELIRLARARNE